MPRRSPKPATEIASYDREAKAVELRSQGYSFHTIADTLGYADASGASKAFTRALKRRPIQNADELRAQEAERLEYCWRKTSEIIENPPVQHSAIGKVVIDPRTNEPVLDHSVKVRAITEYRHLSESYRKLCGVDLDVIKIQHESPDETQLRESVEWARTLAPRIRVLEADIAERDVTIMDLRRQLDRWERGDIVDAELVT